MTTRDIQLLLKFHADELDHIQRTILGLKVETMRLLGYIEDEKPCLADEKTTKKTIEKHNRIPKKIKIAGVKE